MAKAAKESHGFGFNLLHGWQLKYLSGNFKISVKLKAI
ncbi:MAG: hypothetical protein JWR61_1567 [Ferruginibacter sp.]|nr:hypothetical protein [Ferruginibacter sp.]